MKNGKKKFRIILAVFTAIMCFVLVLCACTEKSQEDVQNIDKDTIPAVATNMRFATKPISEMSNPGYALKNSFRDDNFYYYMFYLGSIERVPLQNNVECFAYSGTPYAHSFSSKATKASTVQNMCSEASTNCASWTGTFSAKYGISASAGIDGIASVKANLEIGFSTTVGLSASQTASKSYSNAETYSQEHTQTISFAFNENSALGYYRYILLGELDVFAVIVYDPGTNEYTIDNYEVVVAQYYDLDYSESARFDDNQYGDLPFDLTVEEIQNLGVPEKYIGNNGPGSGPGPVNPYDTSNADFATTTLSTYVWCENKNVGRINLEVQGIKVKYNNKYYVYGNATYNGTPGGTRFNDVDTISFKDTTKKILIGGTLHWRGPLGNNDKSGVAGWNKGTGFDSNNISYIQEDPAKDFAANEEVFISITGICVELGENATINDGIPQIETTTFSSNLYTESTNAGKVNFDVIGIKVRYNGFYYIMGNAYFSGIAGGNRFNDVAEISLRNCTKKVLSGGILHWRGPVGNNDKSGVAVFKTQENVTNNVTYRVEDPGDDFAANEQNIISITGICVELGAEDIGKGSVPKLVKSSFSSDIYCESAFRGSTQYEVIGIEIEKDGAKCIYGNAIFTGIPGNDRFNDVDRIILKNTSKTVLHGGTLFWSASYGDNNECGIAGYNVKESSANEVYYLQEDPGKDFASNEENIISIIGILIALN